MRRSSKTEISPGQVQDTSWLTRPLPRWGLALAAIVAVLLLVQIVQNWRILPAYRKFIFGGLPAFSLPWERLSPRMDEQAVRQLVMQPLDCLHDTSGLGSRTCYASVRDVNGHGALTVAFFFDAGRLRAATVHVPTWAHYKARETLAMRYGRSDWASDGAGGALTRWRVAGGYLDMTTTPDWRDPLHWSAIVWTPGVALSPVQ